METDSWQKVLLWASFVFFLGAALLRQETAINQDLGRHLRLGEMIVSGGEARKCALYSNCLTYTYPEYPFVNHHWGAEAIFYFIYKLGGFGGLILFKALVLGMAFGITVRHASAVRNTQNTQKAGISPVLDRVETRSGENQRASVSDSPTLRFSDISGSPSFPSVLKLSIAVILTFLSINMMADRLTTRPEIFGYLLFSLLFWILNKSYIGERRPARLNALAFGGSSLIYITPAIMLLWVNLHISFVFGLILVWIWAGTKMLNYRFSVARLPDGQVGYQSMVNQLSVSQSETGKLKTEKLETENRKPKTDNRLTLTIALVSNLVTIFNPAGLRGALMPLSIMKDYGYTIVENMTPFFLRAFKPQPEYWIYAGLTSAAVILALVTGKLGKFAGLALLVFSIFPLIAVRHLPFFGLIVPVVLTPLIRSLLAKQGDSWSISGKFAKLPTLISGSLLIAALTNPIPLAYAKLPAVGLTEDKRHEEAVKFARGKQGKMWNNYDIGSYLEWSLPEHKTFVDGRPEAFPTGFFRETYIPMQESRQKWDEVVERYDIQWVFAALTDATPWFGKWRQMIGAHEGWKVIYVDSATAILARQN